MTGATSDVVTTQAPAPPGWQVAGVVALVVIAFGSVLMVAFGQAPHQVWAALFEGTLGDAYGAGQVVLRATTFAATGLSFALAARAGMFNIGVEGQMTAGLAAAAWFGGGAAHGLPAPLAVAGALVAAALAGAAIACGTAALRVWRGAHEVITGLMLNVIIAGVVLWIGNRGWFVGGNARTADIAASAQLPGLGIGGSAANASTFLVVVMVGVAAWVFARTRVGRHVEWAGTEPSVAHGLGLPAVRLRLATLACAGAAAGLVAANLVLGHKHAFEEGMGRGNGYLGIAVALLAGRHLLGIVVAALALAVLSQGGLAIASFVPKELPELLIGVAVVAAAVVPRLLNRSVAT